MVGVPDEEWGERVVAFCVTKGWIPVSGIEDTVVPREWAPAADGVRVDEMPLLPNGKIDRMRLQGDGVKVFSIPLRTRFRGITVREGLLVEGEAGWGEFSPFLEYDAPTSAPWLDCAREAADVGWPAPVRDFVPVNVTVPACSPERAREIVLGSAGCRTAKVKVAEPGQDPGEDEARLEAVRDALGADGLVRIDANAGWSVEEAVSRIGVLERAAGGLEYVEQPVASVEDLARRTTAGGGADRRRRVHPSGGRPLSGAGPRGGRHRRTEGAAAGRRTSLPPDRRGHRPAGSRLQRDRVEHRHRRRGRARSRVAGAAARLRARDRADADRRRGRGAAAAGRRRPSRTPPGGRSREAGRTCSPLPTGSEHWRRRMAEVEAVRQDRRP